MILFCCLSCRLTGSLWRYRLPEVVSLSSNVSSEVREEPGRIYLSYSLIHIGFVMRGYLGGRTLAIKAIALPLSVASGLTLGPETFYSPGTTCH